MIVVYRWMKIYLADLSGKPVEHIQTIALAHAPALQVSVYSRGKHETVLLQPAFHVKRQSAKKQAVDSLLQPTGVVKFERKPSLLHRYSHPARTVFGAQLQRGVEYHRMNVQVKVTVDVRERETG